MRHPFAFACALASALLVVPLACAQDAPKPIGPFVIDVRGTRVSFPSDNQGLADSRGLALQELPGSSFGLDVGAQVYPLRFRKVTIGAGGQVTLGRSSGSGQTQDGVTIYRPVTEKYTEVAGQISFNFGTGSGWSYLSGGFGPAKWSIIPGGGGALPSDQERLRVYNYGGGARWFAKPHLAFNFDVRFHDIYPGSPFFGYPGSPRVKMLVFGAGVSLK
ncbi:MAG TPA: hypothetical protein VHZ73_06130 [Vicinamibacterales bacterium]|jgi:hypothetical protein|nr:hypothetical protein [Vicinamibacterales bacterium]